MSNENIKIHSLIEFNPIIKDLLQDFCCMKNAQFSLYTIKDNL